MSTTEPPTTPAPAEHPPPPPKRRRRPTRSLVLLALGGLALFVVGGVAGALLFSRPAHTDAPGVIHLDAREPWDGPPWVDTPPGRPDRWSGPDRELDRGPGRGPGISFGTRGPLVLGTVDSVGDGTLVVTPDGAAPRTLRTDDRTRVAGPGGRSVSDVKPGQRVVVVVDGSGDSATAVSIWVPQTRFVGTVTAVNGDTATVTTANGLVATVNTGSVSPKPAVGDVVAISGAASGTTITATTITVLPRA
ncbi:hypothetical protein SAMN05443637_11452 [Pseudonocardia thermophila]|jgi:hypothetical protein|uniref:DUF5666 domain-containing protein n=1 Tax=Pseudonocardia thermophila TaxID=1848 RepID=A0A1M6WAR2_PSETH|nr:hypothetical protein [Pseudonocardia thermophila]SHK90606.1 hypothetical protein SAMN05443637_11452 [Pseudonocardia thermophila]